MCKRIYDPPDLQYPASQPLPAPQLKIQKSCHYRAIPFTDDLTIGRTSENDLVLDCRQISRHHARINRHAGNFFLTDCNSIWQREKKSLTP
ncbi:MAG: hypothetical protein DSY57_03580, partial [Desulfobulbus sp.]